VYTLTSDYIELRELRGKIKGSMYPRLVDFAPQIPMAISSLSLKLNGKGDFNTKEIYRISALLNITEDEVTRYFFPNMFRGVTNSLDKIRREMVHDPKSNS